MDINANFDFSALEAQVTFDEIRDELTHSYDIPYLSNRLLPNLEQFAFKPRLRHPCLPRLWYNNCNESYNNVIKRDTKWVIQKLPDLVTKLYELEQDQTRDVRGALFDKGKYVLSKQAAVLKVSYETWTQLLPAQRSRRLLKFVNFKAKASSTLTSTGGHLTIPQVNRIAPIPFGQMKFTDKSILCQTFINFEATYQFLGIFKNN